MTDTEAPAVSLARTPLHAFHLARKGRMIGFAGYEMPVQYPDGIIAEHLHTRTSASLFDVSHMGQAFLVGPDHETTAQALETLVPADILNLGPGRLRYSQFLNDAGGIIDDLMMTRPADPSEDGVLMLVVNAAFKQADFAHLAAALPASVRLLRADHRALIALQGPLASQVLGRHCAETATMPFMSALSTRFDGIECHISRSGYTGEDGYEISVKGVRVRAIVERLSGEPEVRLAGLGARDSLRLEAGLCLSGQDIDPATSPIEAALSWTIPRRRQEEGGFPGTARVLDELAGGPRRLRVGLEIDDRIPARQGAAILGTDRTEIGKVTSGGFSPTLSRPIAMGYVERAAAAIGSSVLVVVRGKELPARIVAMPFVPHRYYRGE